MYRSSKRLHLTRDGKVCFPGDPRSASLLVPAGGEMSDEDARRYGLLGGSLEDALPLDSPAPPPAPSTVPDPSAAAVVAKAAEGFPQTIQFGTPPSAPQPEAPASQPLEPSQPIVTPPVPPPQQVTAPPSQPQTSDLPNDFPFKSILVNQNFGMKAQVKEATKEQLIALDQIGVARADEIIAARDRLG